MAARFVALLLGASLSSAAAFVPHRPWLAKSGALPTSVRALLCETGQLCQGSIRMSDVPKAGYPPEISYGTLPGSQGGGAQRIAEAWTGGQVALSEPAPRRAELQGSSRLFLDTADVAEYSNHLPLGIFHGVTSNPTLLELAGVECSVPALGQLAQTAFSLGAREFMCQAWGEGVGDLVERGRQLAALDARVVVKVPLTAAGVQAASILSRLGVRVCTTACYAPHQVLSSVAAGAEYVAPYVGRMTDSGVDGVAAVAAMNKIVAASGSRTRVLVASIRSAEVMAELAAAGCDTFTISPEVARALVSEPATLAAAAEFEAASKRKQDKSRGIGFAL